MITVFAWIIFPIAFVWNVAYIIVAIEGITTYGLKYCATKENIISAIVSILFLFVPGVYLFGWF